MKIINFKIMESQNLKSKVKSLSELVDRLEDAILEYHTNDDVLDAFCIILGNLCFNLKNKGIDKDTFIKIVNEKINRAFRVAEIKQ